MIVTSCDSSVPKKNLVFAQLNPTSGLVSRTGHSTEILIIETYTKNDELQDTILRKRFPRIRSITLFIHMRRLPSLVKGARLRA